MAKVAVPDAWRKISQPRTLRKVGSGSVHQDHQLSCDPSVQPFFPVKLWALVSRARAIAV